MTAPGKCVGDKTFRHDAENYVTFSLNGKIHKVSGLPGGITLLHYIRNIAKLRGTKFMCREGGCGACIVNLTRPDTSTGIEKSFGVNSCLYALYSCQGMTVTTVEGIGNSRKGYHPVQTRLARFYGTQCGYCTPGWIMAMYSLLKSNRNITMSEIEESFGSNNCRCTGYRSILEAFKTFADDSPPELRNKLADIEDLGKICKKSGMPCSGTCKHEDTDQCKGEELAEDDDDFERDFVELAMHAPRLCIPTEGSGRWYRVTSVQEIFEIFTMITRSYMLIAGNTAQGIYEVKYPTPPDTFIDINGVAELSSHSFRDGYLILGSGMTQTNTIELFRAVAVERPATFKYLEELAYHMTKVAHIPVRNVATLGGNLATKNSTPEFPSDLFTIYSSVGAQIVIDSGTGSREKMSLPEFLELNMHKRVITHIIFPPLDTKTYVIRTYKISRRAQNDHAAINAGFCFKFDKSKDFKVLTRPNIVYGGITPKFVHATQTESFLEGKSLLNTQTLQEALSILDSEVRPTRVLPESSIEYRKGLVFSTFYKYVLGLNPSAVNPRFRSGAEEISRPLSSGKQEYYSDPLEYPLTQPIPKLESLIQCSGEIEYTFDVPTSTNQLYASLVLTDCGPATLVSLEPRDALRIPGVVAFFSAKDIPGINTITNIHLPLIVEYEELFASKEIKYAGQCVGVIIANDQDVADYAAQRVTVNLKDQQRPVLYVEEVIKCGYTKRMKFQGSIDPTAPKKKNVAYKIQGDVSTRGQYHYYFETQTCVVQPRDNNNLDITVSTQWAPGLQEGLSNLLNISANRINIQVKRCGGAYGGKVTRGLFASCSCALAAYILKRPVRIQMNLEANMRCVGGRQLSYTQYEVGVDKEGVIQYLKANFYVDQGSSFNDTVTNFLAILGFPNIYDRSIWSVGFYDVLTDKASLTIARGPGTLTSVGAAEHIMEHIARTVKRDPFEVRLSNMAPGLPIPQYAVQLKAKSDYEQRLSYVREFNTKNQWKKRGISIVPMRFSCKFTGPYHALVSVYRLDGMVAITHGACELGQGVNTKVSQVAAHVLGIPLSYIQVKPVYNITSPNDTYTAASMATDGVCYAVRKCCETINERLAQLRDSLGKDVAWNVLIEAAYALQVNLNATYMFVPGRDLSDYENYGLTVLEVEIDCLTGEHKVVRVDILQNVAVSLNPFIDIGQIEGAFLMGLGHFTFEELIFNPATGLLKTDRTWEYKVPGAKDIPIDWRIYFERNPDSTPSGPYGSKSIAEAPLVMSISVLFAIQRAIETVRRDIGLEDIYLNIEPSLTVEKIFLKCNTKPKDYIL